MGMGEIFLLLRALGLPRDVRGKGGYARGASDMALEGSTKLQGLSLAGGQEQVLDNRQT
jgi:hypothetical protein